MRRANNQDSYKVAEAGSAAHWQERGCLFCVADGMGAHAAGELASQLAVDNVPLNYEKLDQLLPPEAICEAIRQANATIHSRGQKSVEFHGMGTTCTSLLLLPYGAFVAHVGDSRAYRLRNSTLEQLTFDHSLVWEMPEAGSVSEREIPQYVPKNVITRSLGPHESVSVDLEGPVPVSAGDTFLLCSDGLTGPVSDEEIGAILGCMPPEEAAQTLVDLANLRGGPDNITVLVVRVNQELSPQVAETVLPAERTDIDKLPPPPPPVHPALWGFVVAAALAVLYFSVIVNWIGITIAGFALLVGIVLMVAARMSPATESESRRFAYGRGPYRTYECSPNDDVVTALMKLLAELRIVALEQGWDIDWEKVDSHASKAHQARQQQDFRTAIQKLGTSVRVLMQQIRDQNSPPLSDSRIGF